MGLMDAFNAEDRVEITVAQLIRTLDARARAESDFDTAMAMCREGIDPEKILKVYGIKSNEKNTNQERNGL